MAVLEGSRWLSSTRLQRVVQDLQNRQELMKPLTFLDRTVEVQADDNEIIGKIKQKVYAAPIIMPDQKATIVEGGSMRFETYSIPKFKIGSRVNEEMTLRFLRLLRNASLPSDSMFADNFMLTNAENLITGVRQSKNAVMCGMMIGEFSHDKLGIKFTGDFGMPADAKFSVATSWDDPTATPVTDIMAAKRYIKVKYGKEYNRIDLSQAAFDYAVQTTQFREMASLVLGASVILPAGMLNMNDTEAMTQIFQRLVKLTVNIEDSIYRVQNIDASESTYRYMPVDKVILSNSMDDRNAAAFDFAQGLIAETVLAKLISNNTGIGDERFGIVSYYTGNEDLDPPDVVTWAVDRGWARRIDDYVTVVIDVGTFTS